MKKLIVGIMAVLASLGVMAETSSAWKNHYYGYVSGYPTWCDHTPIITSSGTQCNAGHQERVFYGNGWTHYQRRDVAVIDGWWSAPYAIVQRDWYTTKIVWS